MWLAAGYKNKSIVTPPSPQGKQLKDVYFLFPLHHFGNYFLQDGM